MTRSQHDLDLFKLKKNNVTFLMKIARQDYYTRFIEDNSTNPKKLFKAAGSLLRNNMSLLPPHSDDLQLANHISVQKISRVRLTLCRVNCSLNYDTSISSHLRSAVLTDCQKADCQKAVFTNLCLVLVRQLVYWIQFLCKYSLNV